MFIFGVGDNCKRILNLYKDRIEQKEQIQGLIDNKVYGSAFYGYEIKSLEECAIDVNDIVLITTEMPTAIILLSQLRDRMINNIFFWRAYEGENDDVVLEKLLQFINESNEIRIINSLETENLFLKRSLDNSLKQRNYLMGQTDPSLLKCASGGLREKQLCTVRFAHDFFWAGDARGAFHPVLGFGNLLGMVRHNGFIPWDDDLDFLMIRGEYEGFKYYLKERYDFFTFDGIKDFEYGRDYKEWKKNCIHNAKDNIFAIDTCSNLQVVFKTDDCEYIFFDVFSIDQFADDYSFSVHKKHLLEAKAALRNLRRER